MKFAHLKIIVLLIICAGINLSCTEKKQQESQQSKNNLPYTLNEVYRFGESNTLKSLTYDLENDGFDEFLVLFKETKIKYSLRLYRNIIQQVLGQRNYITEEVIDIGLFFKTLNNESRFCVTTKQDDTCFLEVLDDTLGLVTKIPIIKGRDIDGNGYWDGHVLLAATQDLNNDGYPEVILKVQSFYDKQPRGVWVIDIKHQKKLWDFPTGPDVANIVIKDINKDGESEILFGSGALNNGAKANDTDDSHSYLFILNHKGKEIWKRETGGIYSSCYPKVDFLRESDQLKIISLFQSRGPDDNIGGRITIRDAKTLSIDREFPAILSPIEFIISDIDFNLNKEIIITTASVHPKIYILSDTLSLIKSMPIPFAGQCIFVEDLNSDGRNEVIVSNGAVGKTIVLNNKLEKMAEIDLGGSLSIFHQGLGRPKLLTVCSKKDGVVLLEFKRSALISQYAIQDLALGFFCGVIFFVIILLLVKSFKSRIPASKEILLLLNELPVGVLLFDRKKKLLFRNRAAITFINTEIEKGVVNISTDSKESGILEQIKKMVDKTQTLKNGISQDYIEKTIKIETSEILVKIFPIFEKKRHTGYAAIFDDVTERLKYKKTIIWAAMSQKLAHEIKNPLHTVLLTLQRLQMAYQEDKVKNRKNYDKYTNSVIEEVERLRKITDGFMKFTKQKPPEFEVIPAEKLIKSIEERTREWLPEKVAFKVEIEKEMPDIRVDIDQMQRLFFNVFDNAVKAMNGKGRLSLRVATAEWINSNENGGNGEVAVFEVSDTGCGIPDDKLSQLFDPYISLRYGGTGLGLTICKKIVEDHGGQISIHSKKEVGTTVKIEIPVCIEKLK